MNEKAEKSKTENNSQSPGMPLCYLAIGAMICIAIGAILDNRTGYIILFGGLAVSVIFGLLMVLPLVFSSHKRLTHSKNDQRSISSYVDALQVADQSADPIAVDSEKQDDLDQMPKLNHDLPLNLNDYRRAKYRTD